MNQSLKDKIKSAGSTGIYDPSRSERRKRDSLSPPARRKKDPKTYARGSQYSSKKSFDEKVKNDRMNNNPITYPIHPTYQNKRKNSRSRSRSRSPCRSDNHDKKRQRSISKEREKVIGKKFSRGLTDVDKLAIDLHPAIKKNTNTYKSSDFPKPSNFEIKNMTLEQKLKEKLNNNNNNDSDQELEFETNLSNMSNKSVENEIFKEKVIEKDCNIEDRI